MRVIISLVTIVAAFVCSSGIAQVNLKSLEVKGFVVKHKLKPYKKTKKQVLKLMVKNGNEKSQEVNFQLYLYVDGVAESMSDQKNKCLAPKKKVKYRFLFDPENSGVYSVELEELDIKEVDYCSEALK